MEQLREEERVGMDAEIRFRFPDKFVGKMKDFCSGGIGAELPIQLDVDSPVELEIFGGRLFASGHVRWIQVKENTITVGIQFREGDREIIKAVSELTGKI